MKLIQRPEMSQETIKIKVGVKSPSFFDAWRTDEEKVTRREREAYTVEVPGRISYGSALIEDDTNSLVIGEKINTILLDGIKLYGVIPIMQDGNKYECVVDYFEDEQ